MAKLNVVIADSDRHYLEHITNYLTENMHNFEVFSFSSKESLDKFLEEKSHKIDIIAFSEDFADETIEKSSIYAKIILSDGSFVETEEYAAVNKYQKADKFISDLLAIYAEKSGHVEALATGDKDTKIIGVFSPVGGSGKTTVAIALAGALAAAGKRAFYLNAEKINSTAETLNEGSGGGASDVYLAIKTKGAAVGLKIMANKYTDINSSITYFNPAESSLEINEITNGEFEKLLNEFEKLGEFDAVVVDFDSELSKDKIFLLGLCDKIVCPLLLEKTPLAKMELFAKELKMYDDLAEVREKIIYAANKTTSQGERVMQSNPLKNFAIDVKIPLMPIFSDLDSVLHSSQSAATVLRELMNMI